MQSAPWFRPVAGFDEIIGTSADAPGQPLLVAKQIGAARHIYSTLMNLPPEVYAPLLAWTGVHCYHRGLKDPVWVGNDVLFLHAASGGPKTLNLPEGCQARAIIGPFRGTLQSGESFTAEPALTYGFLLEKH